MFEHQVCALCAPHLTQLEKRQGAIDELQTRLRVVRAEVFEAKNEYSISIGVRAFSPRNPPPSIRDHVERWKDGFQ